MAIQTTTVLKANMPPNTPGATSVEDLHHIVDTFGARTKCLNDYFVGGDTDPSHDAFVRMFNSAQNGDTLYIDSGTHTLVRQVNVVSKNGLTINVSRNATIRLTNRAWNVDGARVGIAFHDCSDLTINGGIWDANGAQNNALNTNSKTGQVSVLAIVSDVATTSTSILSRRINVRNCRFIDLFMTGLSLRNTEDAVIENCSFTDPGYVRTRGETGSEAPYLGLALANRTRVLNCSFLGAYNANDAVGFHPGEFSGIIASVGQQSGHIYRTVTDRGRYMGFGYRASLEWTAPASGNTASPSWAALEVDSATYVPADMRFLHLTKNRNGAHDVSPGRLSCTAINNTSKTISFTYNNLAGGQTNPTPAFAGQTIVTFGYKPSGMMKDLTIQGCYFKNMGGAGVFAWGLNGYVWSNNVCLDCRDIGLDAEFTVNGVISNNTITNTPGYVVSSGISILELGHNISVTGNTIRFFDALYGINIETGGPIISDITITGNTISGADVRMRGGGQTGAGCNIGYITISGNTIDGMRTEGGAAYGQNIGIDLVNVCRDITINGNNLINAGFAPISYTNVDGLTVMSNKITHTHGAALGYEIAVSNVNTSRRVNYIHNIMHDVAQTWREGYGMVRRTGATSTENPQMFGNYIDTQNVNYNLTTPYMSVSDGTPAQPRGIQTLQVGGITLRDNGGTLQKSTNAKGPLDSTATWTTIP